ncbi:MAG: Crp/Fnr family transcriptional regulator [Flavobacteriaceae bacterium]|jgi:CRP-like cAMP-binding protein|nr:Crp/Fnr family transcriptional regulator [Flavobacteriaceae bacterium]
MNIEKSSIIRYLSKRKTLSEDEIIFLEQVFEKKIYAENEIVLEKGEICRHIYFIEKGVLKTYFTDDFGKESINGIAIENNFCTSFSSFINQTPSEEFIKTMEKSELIYINFRNFKLLIEKYPIYKDIYVKILEDYLTFLTWRMESVMAMSAKQRYETLMKIFPKLFLKIPNKDIAEYLAITPETLSRVKSQK